MKNLFTSFALVSLVCACGNLPKGNVVSDASLDPVTASNPVVTSDPTSPVAVNSPTPATVTSAQNPVTETKAKKYLASNVMLGGSSSALSLADTEEIDTTTKIRPEQIMLAEDNETVGKLASKNLKDALQNEIAVKLSDVIVGKWKIQNKLAKTTSKDLRPNSETNDLENAEINISKEGIVTLISGCLSFVHTNLCKDSANDGHNSFLRLNNMTIQAAGNSVLILTYGRYYQKNNEIIKDEYVSAILTIAEISTNNLVVVNANVDSFYLAKISEVATWEKIN